MIKRETAVLKKQNWPVSIDEDARWVNINNDSDIPEELERFKKDVNGVKRNITYNVYLLDGKPVVNKAGDVLYVPDRGKTKPTHAPTKKDEATKEPVGKANTKDEVKKNAKQDNNTSAK
jgi:hypothetical protein